MKDIYLNLSIEEVTFELEIEKKPSLTDSDKEILDNVKNELINKGYADENTSYSDLDDIVIDIANEKETLNKSLDEVKQALVNKGYADESTTTEEIPKIIKNNSFIKAWLDLKKTCANMFSGFSEIIDASTYIAYNDTSNVTNMSNMFYQSGVEKIEGLDMIKVTNATNFLVSHTSLTKLILYNIGINLKIGTTYTGEKITVDSLIHICKECIKKSSTLTLTMGSPNLSKISNVYVKFTNSTQTEIAENEKGDVVVCERTDEGAMTITEYMALKSWALA